MREQVELYEGSGGTQGTTLRDTGLPVVIVTHTGNKTGAVRKTPMMRVEDHGRYVLVGSMGGAPTDPVSVQNLRANPTVEIRDHTVVKPMRVREVMDETERARLWKLAAAAFRPYQEYQAKTTRRIPVSWPSRRARGRGRDRAAGLRQEPGDTLVGSPRAPVRSHPHEPRHLPRHRRRALADPPPGSLRRPRAPGASRC